MHVSVKYFNCYEIIWILVSVLFYLIEFDEPADCSLCVRKLHSHNNFAYFFYHFVVCSYWLMFIYIDSLVTHLYDPSTLRKIKNLLFKLVLDGLR